MGCDIHLRVEVKKGGDWRRAFPQWPCWALRGARAQQHDNTCYWCDGTGIDNRGFHDRNYDLFAILADVRNGTWGERFNPIAPHWGAPPDVSSETQAFIDEWGVDGHSLSWQTVAELDAYDWDQQYRYAPCVSVDAFVRMRRNGKSEPDEWAAGMSGPELSVTAAESLVKDPAFEPGTRGVGAWVRYSWTKTYRECVGPDWFEFLDACRKLDPNPENIRFVYFFDN